jgi:hypothetical protein
MTETTGFATANGRHSCGLCQSCYEQARPDLYFPANPASDGTCCACGSWTWGIARVSRAEADEVAETLFATPADRPHAALTR